LIFIAVDKIIKATKLDACHSDRCGT
jgi:hypothetical protein